MREKGSLPIKWVIPGRLAGIARPGYLHALDDDLEALAMAGIRVLACLEEQQWVSPEALQRHGMEPMWLPISPRQAPSMRVAQWLCKWLEGTLESGIGVAFHDRAGLGRTGMMLTAFLIWRGASAPEALSAVRRVEPRFVESAEQLDFLRRFAVLQRLDRILRSKSQRAGNDGSSVV